VNYPERNSQRRRISKNEAVIVCALSHEQQRAAADHEALGTTTVEGVLLTIDPGYRAVSVQMHGRQRVAGLIQTNSRVDVLFTRPGTMAEATTSTILQT